MPAKHGKLRSSRRAAALQDRDIDHEIVLEDHDSSPVDTQSRPSTRATADAKATGKPLGPSESQAALCEGAVPPAVSGTGHKTNGVAAGEATGTRRTRGAPRPEACSSRQQEAGPGAAGQAGEDGAHTKARCQGRPATTARRPETAIDVLYENERGLILCGIPLFSSAALGNYDPSPWTNFAHKPSPTNIKNAQVPDPSWEWAWPEWRVNQDDDIDLDREGWEYSFMFHKRFSWHGPKWWNSCVRRRAWIRRRVKKGLGYQANDPHLLNAEYFRITSPADHHGNFSRAGASRAAGGEAEAQSRGSVDVEKGAEADDAVSTAEQVMNKLRKSRIDREKLDAVQDYLEHATDLQRLEDCMHDIMAMLMFQASRRLLLTILMREHDQAADRHEQDSSPANSSRLENLRAAVKHADEEVRRLEYWSDVSDMARDGDPSAATDAGQGKGKGKGKAKGKGKGKGKGKDWGKHWDGASCSAAGANKERLP